MFADGPQPSAKSGLPSAKTLPMAIRRGRRQRAIGRHFFVDQLWTTSEDGTSPCPALLLADAGDPLGHAATIECLAPSLFLFTNRTTCLWSLPASLHHLCSQECLCLPLRVSASFFPLPSLLLVHAKAELQSASACPCCLPLLSVSVSRSSCCCCRLTACRWQFNAVCSSWMLPAIKADVGSVRFAKKTSRNTVLADLL